MRSRSDRRRQAGQVLPLFALMSVVLLGGAALLTDVAWWWVNEQHMQRAADAGALAGAIYLPGNETLAFDKARAETAKNGFTNGVDGVVVTPKRDPGDPRKLIVDIDGPVNTNFAKVMSMDKVDVGVTGAASYVLPVPMGSPENYYGVFGKLRTPGGGTTETSSQDGATPALVPNAALSGSWTATSGTLLNSVQGNDSASAKSSGDNSRQRFGNFGLLAHIPSPNANQNVTIDGIEVLFDDTRVSASCSNTYVEVHLSDNGGSSFSGAPSPSTRNDSPDLTTSGADFVIGSATSTAAFPDTWSRADFADGRFVVRLTAQKGGSCGGAQVLVDQLRVVVHYTLTTSTFIPDANIADPYDQPLRPQGLWGTFINQGAEKINGDAYLPRWDPRTSRTNAEYDPDSYYNYAVEMPAGASDGEVWIYDPVFCATSGNGEYGTGDRWFGGSGATSAFYTLYDTSNTPYIFSDDVSVADSGSLFRNIRASDASLDGPGGNGIGDCSVGATSNQSDGRYWHNRWWRIASGLKGGKTYRLHTRSTDPGDASAMNNANGHNSFSIWSKATGGSPRIYGLGAMEAFTPLSGGGAATFYLARIDAEHAGKTMVISLWDPGDTGNLAAELRILRPTASDYVETPFSFSAQRVASGGQSCNQTGNNVNYVRTNNGGGTAGVFNGCWLTIEIPLPTDYAAPHPSSDSVTSEGGWWKIRYVMGGSAAQSAFDLTTWEVALRGNPVHLVLK